MKADRTSEAMEEHYHWINDLCGPHRHESSPHRVTALIGTKNPDVLQGVKNKW